MSDTGIACGSTMPCPVRTYMELSYASTGMAYTSALRCPVLTKRMVQDEWMEGAHNPGMCLRACFAMLDGGLPGFFIHPRDRYVKVGGIIHPPSDDDEEEEDAEEGEREQQEGEGEHENEGEVGPPLGFQACAMRCAEHREERARTIQQLSAGRFLRQVRCCYVMSGTAMGSTPRQPRSHTCILVPGGSLNSPNAPTLEGGVSVPGGRVVWLPLNQLSAGAAPASSLAPSAQTVPVAPQQIPMPQVKFGPTHAVREARY
eukprot:3408034-Rhodomonas_salina.3